MVASTENLLIERDLPSVAAMAAVGAAPFEGAQEALDAGIARYLTLPHVGHLAPPLGCELCTATDQVGRKLQLLLGPVQAIGAGVEFEQVFDGALDTHNQFQFSSRLALPR